MKKCILPLFLSVFLVFVFTSPIQAQDIPITIDGQVLKTDQPPVIQDGRTLVPLRAIFEGLGADVSWDDINRTITSSRSSSYISLTVDQRDAYINGQQVTLDVPPTIINNRTLVPVRVVGEALKATVTWNAESRSITIDSNDSYVGISRIDFQKILPDMTVLPPDSIGTLYVEARYVNTTPYAITAYSLKFLDRSTGDIHYLSAYDTVLSGENSPKFKTFAPKSGNKSDMKLQELELTLETPHGKFYVDYDYQLNKITQLLKAS